MRSLVPALAREVCCGRDERLLELLSLVEVVNFREAVDDVRYITTLEKLIARPPSAKKRRPRLTSPSPRPASP